MLSGFLDILTLVLVGFVIVFGKVLPDRRGIPRSWKLQLRQAFNMSKYEEGMQGRCFAGWMVILQASFFRGLAFLLSHYL